jgi:hypothetical protein
VKRIENLLKPLGRIEFLCVSTDKYEIGTWGRANATEGIGFNLLSCSSQLGKEECATMVLFVSHKMTKKN